MNSLALRCVKRQLCHRGVKGMVMGAHLQGRSWSQDLTAYIAECNVLLPGRRVGGTGNPAYLTLRRDDFRTRLWEPLTTQEQPCQFAIDVAACLDAGDDFLPNIATFGIAEGGLEIGFDRDRLLRHITPIDGNASFNAHCIQHLQAYSTSLTGLPMCPEGVPHTGQSGGRCEQLIAQLAGITPPYTAHRMASELASGTGVHWQCRGCLP